VDWLSGQIVAGKREWGFVGMTDGALSTVPLKAMTDLVDTQFRRPIDQWWLELQPIMVPTHTSGAAPRSGVAPLV